VNGELRQAVIDAAVDSTSTGLLHSARERDPDAWRRMVQLYGPLVDAWCRDAKLQECDLADVFQDVFSAAAARIASFRHDRSGDTLRGWLRAITRNKLRDFFRNRAAEPRGIGGSEAHRRLNGMPAVRPPAVETVDRDASERSLLFRRAVELVETFFEPQTFRAFWRTAVDGHNANAVAEELGMSPAAVRKAKSRVLRKLRDEFGQFLS
jgi:RNA polymerase sigma-70 factor (ECF subfamily)